MQDTNRDYTKNPLRKGSAPIAKKRVPVQPAEKPLDVTLNDPEIVREAAQKYCDELTHHMQNVQTQGHQKGFTKSSIEEILNK